MSYTPTEWATGDVITAEKLNNMEDGIVKAGRAFKITVTATGNNGGVMDKTCGEIKGAIMNGSIVFGEFVRTQGDETVYIQLLPTNFSFYESGGCAIELRDAFFAAATDNDYPATVSD